MTMHHPSAASPESADVPFRPGRPPWQPPWGPPPAPSPAPPVPPAPVYSPAHILPPGNPPGIRRAPGSQPRPGSHEPFEVYERLMERRIVMAHGHLDDEAATGLCAQLLTLDAEGDGPIRFELQNLGADLTAALTLMGVLDVVGVPVEARAAGRMSGAALGVLAVCEQRRAYPNALFVMSEPTVEFGGPLTAVTAREEQMRNMLDSLYFRLADVTGREVDELRADARARRVLTAAEAQRYGLLTSQIERR
jgi:ATP-dependent Clp protease, protease subunit